MRVAMLSYASFWVICLNVHDRLPFKTPPLVPEAELEKFLAIVYWNHIVIPIKWQIDLLRIYLIALFLCEFGEIFVAPTSCRIYCSNETLAKLCISPLVAGRSFLQHTFLPMTANMIISKIATIATEMEIDTIAPVDSSSGFMFQLFLQSVQNLFRCLTFPSLDLFQ